MKEQQIRQCLEWLTPFTTDQLLRINKRTAKVFYFLEYDQGRQTKVAFNLGSRGARRSCSGSYVRADCCITVSPGA